MLNALKQYHRTRAKASSEAVKGAKALPHPPPVHPLFGPPPGDENVPDLRAALKDFRPTHTIFEVHSTAATQSLSSLMAHQRRLHESAIQKRLRPPPPTPSTPPTVPTDEERPVKRAKKSFKDPEFYLSPLPSQGPGEADYALQRAERGEEVSVEGDEAATVRGVKNVQRWDRLRKKFVWTRPGVDPNDKKQWKNESGVKVKSSDGLGKLYQKWKDKHKAEIQKPGEEENVEVIRRLSQSQTSHGRYRKGANPPKPPAVPSELKSKDQIQKQRKAKEKEASRLKAKKNKGKGKKK